MKLKDKRLFARGGHLAVVVAAMGGVAVSTSASACGVEPFLGDVCFTAGSYCPNGYSPADGQALSVSQNQALFAVLGVAFGGDGKTSFKLPDLRGRMEVGSGYGPGLTPLSRGDMRGVEYTALQASQAPLLQHVHPATFSATTGTTQVTIPAVQGSGTSLTGTGTVDVAPGAGTATGSTAAPAASTSYYLTGANGKQGLNPITMAGPYTTAQPTAGNKATVGNVSVSVDASGMKPNIPAQTVNIDTVTGGAVNVAPNPAVDPTSKVAIIPPQVAMTACIAVQGQFPPRPN